MSRNHVHYTGKNFALNTTDIINQAEAKFVNERGDKMKGNLDMGGNKIFNVPDPIENDEVVNKNLLNREIKDLKYVVNNILVRNEENLKQQIINLKKEYDTKVENQEKEFDNKIKNLEKEFNSKIVNQNNTITNTRTKYGELKETINSPRFFDVIQEQRIEYIKKEHKKLRLEKTYLNIISDHRNLFTQSFNHEFNKSSSEIAEYYFPGILENERSLCRFFLTPYGCTIFLVVEMHDEMGLISYTEDNVMFFNLSDVTYFVYGFQKRLETFKKYSFVLKFEKQKLIDIIITNDSIKMKMQLVKTTWPKKHNFTFDRIMVGKGKGILYDLIVYSGILNLDEINKKVWILNNIHKII
jgi:hypothetical protein